MKYFDSIESIVKIFKTVRVTCKDENIYHKITLMINHSIFMKIDFSYLPSFHFFPAFSSYRMSSRNLLSLALRALKKHVFIAEKEH